RDLLVGQLVRLRDGGLVVGDEHADDTDDEERRPRDRPPLEGGDHPAAPPGALALAPRAAVLGARLRGTHLAPALRHNLLRFRRGPRQGCPGPPLSMTRSAPRRRNDGGP